MTSAAAVCLIADDAAPTTADQALGQRLGLDWHAQPPPGANLALRRREDRLGLEAVDGSDLGRVEVDFCRGALGYRGGAQRARHEQVVKACGLLRGPTSRAVFDATGGLGGDAFMLASAGAAVRIVERHPVVAALLADGLERAREAGLEAAHRMYLEVGDSRQVLAGCRIDVVYLDPMYPPRSKSALGGREMRLLAALLGGFDEPAALLAAALQAAVERVVMKRPQWAAPTVEPAPPALTQGRRGTRFDIWIPRQLPAPVRRRLGLPPPPPGGSAEHPDGNPHR